MKKNSLKTDATLYDAISSIESSYCRMVVIVNVHNHVVGTVTDGDIRRCLLRGGDIKTLAVEAMNTLPIVAVENSATDYLLDLLRKRNVLAIPLTDANGFFSRIIHLSDIVDSRSQNSQESYAFAVIMAGGEGRRLRPLTDSVPKPMIEIGGSPLLERQIMRLKDAGVYRIYLAINYLGNVIEDYFGNGKAFGVEIRYLKEKVSLGTAGALTLLPEVPTRSILVMNGDILTFSDFQSMYSYHKEQAADITIAAIDYRINIPYGVIRREGACVKEIHEKPSEQFLCNAGVYAISPVVLNGIEKIKKIDMTDIIERQLTTGGKVSVFPIHEYWSDVGTLDDLEKARIFFSKKKSRD